MKAWRTRVAIVGGAGALALFTPARLGAQTTVVTLQGLGDLPGGDFESTVRAVSADGSTVVGRGSTDVGREAFRWTATGGMGSLGLLVEGYGDSAAWAVSADGSVVVGQSSSLALEFGEAFRWTQSSGMTGLSAPAEARGSSGYAISADGSVIVGGISGEMGPEAFRWTAGGGFTTLHPFTGQYAMSNALAISADGGIAGGLGRTPTTYPNTQAFLWTAGTGAELGGLVATGVWSSVNALSTDGDVAVGWSNSPEGTQAFRWVVDTGMTGLGDLPGGSFNSVANACSADGAIIVGSGNTDNGQEAFMWTSTTGIVSIAEFLAANGVSLNGWVLNEAVGVSADGSVIVGNGVNPNGEFEVWMVTVRTTPPPGGGGGDPDPDPNPNPNPDPNPGHGCKKFKRHHHSWMPNMPCVGRGPEACSSANEDERRRRWKKQFQQQRQMWRWHKKRR